MAARACPTPKTATACACHSRAAVSPFVACVFLSSSPTMKVILFGATGMVGQAALRECLRAPDVDAVLALVRSPSGQRHDKLRELVAADFYDLSSLAGELGGFDVCLFCLGVSAAGMSEA